MTPGQQTALESLVGRSLTASEITSINQQLVDRHDAEIANILSVGRVKHVTREITERGIRAALGVVPASRFIRLLKDASTSTSVPVWLENTLSALAIPADQHQDYADAFASAYGWLRQEAGLDIGSAATRAMLDVIAASDPVQFGAAVIAIKALAETSNPISANEVSKALEGI